MLRQQVVIFREFIKNKVSYVQHVLQVLVHLVLLAQRGREM